MVPKTYLGSLFFSRTCALVFGGQYRYQVMKITYLNISLVYGWRSKNLGKPPNHPFVHRVFHYSHHPFWWFSPYFWKHPYGQKNIPGNFRIIRSPTFLEVFLPFHTNSALLSTGHRFAFKRMAQLEELVSEEFIPGIQVIQSVTFLSPIWRSPFQPFKGSR